MNRCLEETVMPEWITTLIQKDPTKGTAPQQLQTHIVPTDDVENANSTN